MADDILAEKGIPVVPDILSAAGGVVVSYFEWVQNLANERWDEPDVHTRLKSTMVDATGSVIATRSALMDQLGYFRESWERVQPEAPTLPKPTLRTAAHALAVQRLRRAVEHRGVWP
jgi:glutamate dehydrogenase (NAD(P)+)